MPLQEKYVSLVFDKMMEQGISEDEIHQELSGASDDEIQNFAVKAGEKLGISNNAPFSAFSANLMNMASFEQLSRVEGLATAAVDEMRELFGDKSVGQKEFPQRFKENTTESQRDIEVLQETNPWASGFGNFAGLFVGPVGATLKALGAGAKVVRGGKLAAGASKLARVADTARKIGTATAEGAIGGAALAGIPAALGTGTEKMDLERGGTDALRAGLIGGAISGGGSAVFRLLGGTYKGVMQVVRPELTAAMDDFEKAAKLKTNLPEAKGQLNEKFNHIVQGAKKAAEANIGGAADEIGEQAQAFVSQMSGEMDDVAAKVTQAQSASRESLTESIKELFKVLDGARQAMSDWYGANMQPIIEKVGGYTMRGTKQIYDDLIVAGSEKGIFSLDDAGNLLLNPESNYVLKNPNMANALLNLTKSLGKDRITFSEMEALKRGISDVVNFGKSASSADLPLRQAYDKMNELLQSAAGRSNFGGIKGGRLQFETYKSINEGYHRMKGAYDDALGAISKDRDRAYSDLLSMASGKAPAGRKDLLAFGDAFAELQPQAQKVIDSNLRQAATDFEKLQLKPARIKGMIRQMRSVASGKGLTPETAKLLRQHYSKIEGVEEVLSKLDDARLIPGNVEGALTDPKAMEGLGKFISKRAPKAKSAFARLNRAAKDLAEYKKLAPRTDVDFTKLVNRGLSPGQAKALTALTKIHPEFAEMMTQANIIKSLESLKNANISNVLRMDKLFSGGSPILSFIRFGLDTPLHVAFILKQANNSIKDSVAKRLGKEIWLSYRNLASVFASEVAPKYNPNDVGMQQNEQQQQP